jgi:predicted Rossmann-fold nucleotide-binding protein
MLPVPLFRHPQDVLPDARPRHGPFPGGFGTMDELFEALTLIQTKKITPIPILVFGMDYWRKIINFEAMVDAGVISA